MKFTSVVFAAATAVALMSAPASATDINQLCLDTVAADAAAAGVEANPAAAEGCACLAAAAEGNAEMTANIEMVAAMPAADREGHSSEATAAALAECFPAPEAAAE